MSAPLGDRILAQSEALRGYVARRAASLLDYEDLDDLVHAVLARAIDRAPLATFPTDEELRAWLFTVASRMLDDRRDHWRTVKRGAARVARLTRTERPTSGVPLPASAEPGPATHAERRELLVLCARALEALPPRDRDLVRWRAEGLGLEEQARRLGVGYEAAQRAGLRAFERFRKVVALAARGRQA